MSASITATARLPFRKITCDPYNLEFEARLLDKRQKRFAGKFCLAPKLDLNQYRFRAVIDWIEFEVTFNRGTQHQHVQPVIEQILSRKPYVKPVDAGDGNVSDRFSIKLQEPSLATVFQVADALGMTFGMKEPPRITGIEISIDAYPDNPSDQARAKLLGAMQRTIFTARDIWSDTNSRPRVAYGEGPGKTYPLLPMSEAERVSAGASRLVPAHHEEPAVDGTMYLGAKKDDVMIRLMDKVIDTQNRKAGTADVLEDHRKRVRIEVTLKKDELQSLGLDRLPDLRGFKFTRLQGRYFQFKLPTFPVDMEESTSGLEAVKAEREMWRVMTFTRSGIVGLMAMEAEREAGKKAETRALKRNLKSLGKKKVTSRVGTGSAGDLVAYEELNKKVALALRHLGDRERRGLASVAVSGSVSG